MSQRPTVLIEASTRGHVASNIVADVEPEFLILFCLARFGDDSIDLPFRERSTAAYRGPARFEHPSLRSDLGQSLFVAGNDDRIVAPRSKFGCGKMPRPTTTTCEPVHVSLTQMVLTSSRYPGERRELMAIERYRLPFFQ